MQKINLRDFYSFYKSDCFVEVTDDIANVLQEYKRSEAAYQRRTYWNRAHFSLDRNDGIEQYILFADLSPGELYEQKVTSERINAAIAGLPEKQAKRVYAYYFFGMSKADIARAEGVNKSQVTRSISKALIHIKKFLKKVQ